MKILTAEIQLREETRGLQQAKSGLASEKYAADAKGLNLTQGVLTDRTDEVIAKIVELPNGEKEFAKEIKQLSNAVFAMNDAEEILSMPETGSLAIAAETEAIEWLLQAKRAGKGGGGGGSDPGGGTRSGGDLVGSALAALGESKEQQAVTVERNVDQSTGKAGRELPAEFRAGLDQYFEAIERQR